MEVTINKTRVIVCTVLVSILLFFIFCFRIVGVGQVGLVTRFGRINREAGSGVLIKLPWPMERLSKISIQVQKEQAIAAASTSDLQDVNTTLALNYHIDPNHVKELYTSIGGDYKVRVIDPAIQEAFKATSAQFTATELLQKRPLVKERAFEILKSRLEHRNIIVDDVSIINFNFSRQFTQAIEAKQVSAQQAEQAKYEVEKAKNQAAAAIVAAQGQKTSQQLVKQTLTPELLQKYAIDKWNGVMPLYIGGGAVFNIPLK